MYYQILLANDEQREWIFKKHWSNPEIQQRVRDKVKFIFIAVDEIEDIIGYLRVEEKAIPLPLSGTAWWIASINTYVPYRRRGIATAMLNALKNHAEQSGIQYLMASAEPTRHSCLFWWNNNFSMQRYAQQKDESKLEEFGNWAHMAFYRISNKLQSCTLKQNTFRIEKASREQLDWIHRYHISSENQPKAEYYHANRNDFFGFVAVDENEKIAGIIAVHRDELAPPLTGTVWATTYIYVHPNSRRQGVGSALISEVKLAAEQGKVEQILFLAMYEKSAKFLSANNLDIFFWKHISDQNEVISAGWRIF